MTTDGITLTKHQNLIISSLIIKDKIEKTNDPDFSNNPAYPFYEDLMIEYDILLAKLKAHYEEND